MELNDLILSLNNNNYSEIIRFYNQGGIIKHIFDPGQKRVFCKKMIEYFSGNDNIKNFIRNNFTSEIESYLKTLVMSNPLNGLSRIEGEENLKKIEIFRRCGFIFNIKKDYFAVSDEIFQTLFKYFSSEGLPSGETAEIKEYINILPDFEYSFKMSRVYLDPYFHFIKFLYLAIARDLTQTTHAGEMFETAVKDMRGRFPMLDTIRKFIDSSELLVLIKKGEFSSEFYSLLDSCCDGDWLVLCAQRFIKESIAVHKPELLEGFVKKLKSGLYYNLKACRRPMNEIEPAVKYLLCCGACEVIYSNMQPVYIKLSTFGEKIYNILFPCLESLAADMNVKKKAVRRSALLTPDFKLICENLDIGQYIKILCFSNILSFDNIFTFEINKDTIIRSIKLGMNFSEFKSFIQKTIKGDTPDNVMKCVSDWYLSVVVMNETKCVLIGFSASPDRLSEIEKDPYFTSCVLMKVKTNQYIALPEKADELKKYFTDRSIPLITI